MVEKWGWGLPLASPQELCQAASQTLSGLTLGPPKGRGSALWWALHPREERQRRLPSNVDSSAHVQDLLTGALVCVEWGDDEFRSWNRKDFYQCFGFGGQPMSRLMIRESPKLGTLRFHFFFISKFSSSFFFLEAATPCLTWFHHCPDGVIRWERRHVWALGPLACYGIASTTPKFSVTWMLMG